MLSYHQFVADRSCAYSGKIAVSKVESGQWQVQLKAFNTIHPTMPLSEIRRSLRRLQGQDFLLTNRGKGACSQ